MVQIQKKKFHCISPLHANRAYKKSAGNYFLLVFFVPQTYILSKRIDTNWRVIISDLFVFTNRSTGCADVYYFHARNWSSRSEAEE